MNKTQLKTKYYKLVKRMVFGLRFMTTKKLILSSFSFIIPLLAICQIEDFEGEPLGGNVFTVDGVEFTMSGDLLISEFNNFSCDGNTGLNRYMDTGFLDGGSEGVIGSVSRIDGELFLISTNEAQCVWPGISDGNAPTTGTIRLTGTKLDNTTVSEDFTLTSSNFFDLIPMYLAPTIWENTYLINLEFEIVDGMNYWAMDNFAFEPVCFLDLPAPVLGDITPQDVTIGTNPVTRYFVPVENWVVFPEAFFDPTPELPPCGANTNAARAWIDFRDGDGGFLSSYCALSSSSNLQGLFFTVPQDECPPDFVKIEIHDRLCDIFYISDPIPIAAVDSNDAESGWGIWNDGGADAARTNNPNYANSGDFSFLIKDNTTTSVITTDALDLESVETLFLDFNFITTGFNNSNQDFWLQISTDGGDIFETVEEWVYNQDFENELRVFETVSIDGPFSSNTLLRLKCDATGNNDKVYIDDLEIKNCFDFVPTCDDGIQNGDETGVDCGGSNCAPCSPCSDLDFNDAELGWGIWNDGGADAARANNATFANSGSFSFLIKDNTTTSHISTDVLALQAYDEIKVDFNFITDGFNDSSQDFWLQISTDNGASFTTISAWFYGDEFLNGERLFQTIPIYGPFSDECIIRFQCDATGNNDKVYIDDISIEGCVNNSASNEIETVGRAIEAGLEFNVFPNPISQSGSLNLNIKSQKEVVNLRIVDIYGQVVCYRQIQKESFNAVNLTNLNIKSGTYFISVDDGTELKVEKLIVGN